MIVPLYAMAILLSVVSAQVVTTVFYAQSIGTYSHYFNTFLRVDDVLWSFLEVIIMSVIVMLNHCYFGFYASGGAVGVGEAVGKSMRTSLVAIVVVVLFASLALCAVWRTVVVTSSTAAAVSSRFAACRSVRLARSPEAAAISRALR